ncbi:MAG: phosphate ABC transporter substrate-binding protein, PhoT family [Chitinophagaceae bacterium]
MVFGGFIARIERIKAYSRMNKISLGYWFKLLPLVFVFSNCGGDSDPNVPTDTYDSGTIHISVDESFKPVIDSQIQVYESSYPKTKIIADYKPEAECLKDLRVDSVRMIIATRGYTPAEKAFLNDSVHVDASKEVIARDAIAVVINPASNDTTMTMADITAILTGVNKKYTPVMDGTSATSTVRFIIDSVLKGGKLSPSTVGAKSSNGVIDYVAKSPNAIGFLGVSWIGNPEDSTQLSYLSKVKVVQIETPDKSKYVTPAQYNIYFRKYPMIRDLVYILKEKNTGLGHGFANFLRGQRGQLIFKRAYLMPVMQPNQIRNAAIRE